MLDPALANEDTGLGGFASGQSLEMPAPRRRLIPWLGVAQLVAMGTMTATSSVLLPNQLALVDAPNKVADLAIVTSTSFAVAVVVQPIVGLLSDRTRSLIGRRAPWMLAGAIAVGLTLSVMGSLPSVPAITVAWIALQVGFNTTLAPTSAIVPDQIPISRRGLASTVIGIGFLLGAATATFAAAALATSLPVAYLVFGTVFALGTVAFVIFNRDRTAPAPWSRLDVRAVLRSFWVNPITHPDFAWAFAARFLFVLGYYALFSFLLYVLTDYLGMSLIDANSQIGVLTVAGAAGSLVGVTVGGLLSDRLDRRKPFLYAASALMAIGLALPLLWPTLVAVIILSVLFGMGFGLYQSADAVLMTLVLPDPGKSAAKDLGLLNLANTIPQALAPTLGAAIVLATGSYAPLFIAGIVIVIVAGVALVPIRVVR